MTKVLVTGATGFVGNYVINYLLKNNFHVIASSRNESSAKQKSWYKNVQFIPLNLNQLPNNLFNFLNKPDCVINLAWQGLPNYNELFHFEVNTINHYNFIKNLINQGCKNILVTGTCFEYGKVEGEVEETNVTNPNTSYGLAKDTLRKYILELNKNFDFNFNWLRLFYVYGEGQSKNSLYSLVNSAILENKTKFDMSGGQQVRDFIRIERVAEIISTIVMHNLNCGIINCGSGNPTTVEAFVKNILKEKSSNMQLNLGTFPYNSYEPMSFWASTKKLNNYLNKYQVKA